MSKPDYLEFQARTQPLAYLITFRTYGTWLHGHERGAVDRRFHNRVGESRITPNAGFIQYNLELLKHPPMILNLAQRQAVEDAITEVCAVRGYHLHAVNARSNHVHAVVNAAAKPELVMGAFKSYGTRRLRKTGLIEPELEPWARHGSTPYLWTEEEVARAVDYVLHGQDGELFERYN